MNALEALDALKDHPAFKRELAELLENARPRWHGYYTDYDLADRLKRLGAQIELRDSLDRDEREQPKPEGLEPV